MLTTYKVHLYQKTQLTSDVFHLKFILDEPKEINFNAGQYMILLVPQNKGEPARRLYSIASSSLVKDSFELLIKRVPNGAGSNYLTNLKVNDGVDFQGPAGVFGLKNTPNDKVFLATGCGIAPIRSMFFSILNRKSEISNLHLFWGLPTFKDVYFFGELKNYALRMTNFHFKICLSREKNLETIKEEDRKYFFLGHVDKCLDNEIENSEFYLCGSRDVTDSLKNFLLTKKNISPDKIVFEKF